MTTNEIHPESLTTRQLFDELATLQPTHNWDANKSRRERKAAVYAELVKRGFNPEG